MQTSQEDGFFRDVDIVLPQFSSHIKIVKYGCSNLCVGLPGPTTAGTTIQAGRVRIIYCGRTVPHHQYELGKILCKRHGFESILCHFHPFVQGNTCSLVNRFKTYCSISPVFFLEACMIRMWDRAGNSERIGEKFGQVKKSDGANKTEAAYSSRSKIFPNLLHLILKDPALISFDVGLPVTNFFVNFRS